MYGSGTIQYLQNKEIDKDAWDKCITRSVNGLIYGYSFYLDHMADNWDALVLGDYEAVMPLPWRKKIFISYIYQPFLTAQLGMFGNNLSAGLLQDFFESVPRKFQYWDFPLNHSNLFSVHGFRFYERMNYVLDLDKPYQELYQNYRENIRRNIRKSKDFGCFGRSGIGIKEIIHLARLQAKEFTDRDWQQFEKLFNVIHKKGMAKTYGIYSVQNELLASCVFFFSHKRASYILVGNHPNGRGLGASHALIDTFITDHAERPVILDFEGSDIRNLAFFYSSFGAREEKYPAVRLNRLPSLLKWLKK